MRRRRREEKGGEGGGEEYDHRATFVFIFHRWLFMCATGDIHLTQNGNLGVSPHLGTTRGWQLWTPTGKLTARILSTLLVRSLKPRSLIHSLFHAVARSLAQPLALSLSRLLPQIHSLINSPPFAIAHSMTFSRKKKSVFIVCNVVRFIDVTVFCLVSCLFTRSLARSLYRLLTRSLTRSLFDARTSAI